jgi:uncharacterized LabA/DUF88 family protein
MMLAPPDQSLLTAGFEGLRRPALQCGVSQFIRAFNMTVPRANQTALFIDGNNLHYSAKALGFEIDYKRLLKEFQSGGTVLRAFYYSVVVVNEDQEFSAARPLLDWLDYNGFNVVTKPAKEVDDGEGRRKFKRSLKRSMIPLWGDAAVQRGRSRSRTKGPDAMLEW